MSDPALPPSIEAELADLRRRLAALERAPQLPFSSTKGGRFRFLGNAGEDRFALGNVAIPDNPAGGAGDKYGVFAYGDGGAAVLGALEGNRGLAWPGEPAPVLNLNEVQGTSSTSFTTVGWGIHKDTPNHEVLVVDVGVNTTVGTGQVRLRDVVSGATTAAASVATGLLRTVRFEWLHPATVGWGDTRAGRSAILVARIEAKAAAGGTCNVGHPDECFFHSLTRYPNAATDGNPQVNP